MALRFSPPTHPLTAADRWCLAAAFGGRDATTAVPPDGNVFARAAQLDLLERIGSRQDESVLSSAFGQEKLRLARAAQLESLRSHHRIRRTLEDHIVPVLGAHECFGVLLKGPALVRAGFSSERGRPSGDVDVLVPRAQAHAIQDDLIGRGFVVEGIEEGHQLPLLRHSEYASVEVHTTMPGVRWTGDSTFCTAETLVERDALDWVISRTLALPHAELLLAHAIAHGYVYHGASPAHYPLLRMVSDVADLFAAKGPSLLDLAWRWLERDMTAEEVWAVAGLALVLAAGEVPSPSAPPAMLLQHILAAADRTDYVEALRWHRVFHRPSDGPWLAELWRGFAGARLRYQQERRSWPAALAGELWRTIATQRPRTK